MRGVHHDDDYHYIYDDEFYLKEISTPKKPGTPITQAPPPVALDHPPLPFSPPSPPPPEKIKNINLRKRN